LEDAMVGSALNDVLEAAARLSVDEQETLVEVLERRLVELRRQEMAREVREGLAEYEAGSARATGTTELLGEILS
jgi:hypothetical protein